MNETTSRRPAAGPDSAASTAAPMEPLLTKDQAAQFLCVSVRKVEQLMASGELPRVRIGSLARIRPADLRRYVAGAVERR